MSPSERNHWFDRCEALMKEMLDKHRRDGVSFGREVLVANLAALITLLGDEAVEVAQNDAQLLVHLVTKAMDDLA